MFKLNHLFRSPSVQKIFKLSAIYASGNFINRAIPFILIPILTRYLAPKDYGILATFMAIFGIVQIIIYMGTTDAIIRGFFDRGKDDFRFSEYVFNGFLINFIVFFGIILLWLLLKNVLIKLIPIPFNFQLLIPLMGFFAAVSMIPGKLWVVMKKPLSYTLFYTSSISLELILSIFLVVFLSFNWKGRIWGMSLSKLLFLMIGIYVLFRYDFFKITFNKNYIKDIIKYGFPVALHSLGFVVIAAIDKFFLNKFIGLSTTGIYSVSYSICSLIGFLTGAFNAAWVPVIYEKLGKPTQSLRTKLVKFTYIYFILVLLGVFLFINFVPYILSILVGNRFLGAKIFIFWLALGFGFHAMYTMVVVYIFYEKKTYVLSKIALITIILSIIFNYILIKINGPIGVAQATFLVFLSRFLLVWYFSNKVYPMPWFSFVKV